MPLDTLGPLVVPPLGLSSLGLFHPTPYVFRATPPAGILADAIDYGNTDPLQPPAAATFEYTSLTRGLHPIDEQVLVALSRIRASGAAVQNDGARFLDVGKLDEGAKTILGSEARTALRRLVTNGDIALVSIKVFIVDDSAEVDVAYRNLRALDRQRVRKQKKRFQEWAGANAA